ncbi:MAG: hypothetical protein ABIP48_06110 [Planctomycetota bacterium]
MSKWAGLASECDGWLYNAGAVYWRCKDWQDSPANWGEVPCAAQRYHLTWQTLRLAEWLEENTTHDTTALRALADELEPLRNRDWKPRPDDIIRQNRAAKVLVERLSNQEAAGGLLSGPETEGGEDG